ncbi:hypothetical protein N7519_009844 [Penicillium mononematosum]|uniref:uncharacterized protein n=1 Tax=Penicillium mononematosum TaxID=268346 RepID=UPI002549800A|nr:uncharacterized protein N7519_009844 [Penicillium mononematosum]KAJ6179383.1 hypothetical protein N7519_009844 [Penicillium mononematosum]
MIGIHGFSGISTEFKQFVSLMAQRVTMSPKQWIYFPLNLQESITAAWVRKYKACRGPALNPVLVNGDGPVSGVFHDTLDPEYDHVTDFGVTCNDSSQGGALDLLRMDTRLEPQQFLRAEG